MFRAAVIGSGFGAAHVAWLAAVPGTAVVGLGYSTDHVRAHQLARAHGIPTVTNEPAELLADASIDLIAIATPPASHEPLARVALEHGKLVVVDKPLTADLRSAERLEQLGRAHPGRHAVVFQWRRNQGFAAARGALADGRLGHLLHIDLVFHHDFLAGDTTPFAWRHDPRTAGAGALADQAVHLFDLLPWLTGRTWTVERSTTVVAFPRRLTVDGPEVAGGTDDIATVELRDGDGSSRARVLVSRVSAGLRRVEAIAVGTAGTAVVTADPDDGSTVLRLRTAAGDDDQSFGPDPMNPYLDLLGDTTTDRLQGPSFLDGLAAQRLLDAATVTASTPVAQASS